MYGDISALEKSTQHKLIGQRLIEEPSRHNKQAQI